MRVSNLIVQVFPWAVAGIIALVSGYYVGIWWMLTGIPIYLLLRLIVRPHLVRLMPQPKPFYKEITVWTLIERNSKKVVLTIEEDGFNSSPPPTKYRDSGYWVKEYGLKDVEHGNIITFPDQVN